MKNAIIAIFLVSILFPAVYADDETNAASDTIPTVLVKTAIVSERNVSDSLPAFGTVEPAPHQLVTLAAPRDSRIASLAVSSGETVRKGQILLTLAPTPASRAAFVQAQSAADYAKTALAHARGLYKEHLATRDQVAAAEQAWNDAQANLENAEQAGGVGPLALRATAAGVVMSIAVHAGDQVAADTTLLTLSMSGALTVRLGIAPDRISDIHIGMPVHLQDVYRPALQFNAKVTNVSSMVDGDTGLADVFVRLPAQVPGLMPGSYVQGTVTLSDIHGPAVPRSAVLTDGGQAYVFVVQHQIAHRVNITQMADDGTWIALKGGLEPGAEVVTLGNYELDDGMHIRKGSN